MQQQPLARMPASRTDKLQRPRPNQGTDISATATRNGYFYKGHGQGPRANQATKPLQRPRPTKPPNRGKDISATATRKGYFCKGHGHGPRANQASKPRKGYFCNGHGQTKRNRRILPFHAFVHNAEFNQQQTTRLLIRHSGSS